MKKTPEQIVRDDIDTMLDRPGWVVVDKTAINWGLGPGLAIREYQTDAEPVNYVLFEDLKPIGVIEAKKETKGHRLSVHEQQAEFYAQSRLKWFADSYVLQFVYERTGILTQFTNMRDPKPPTPRSDSYLQRKNIHHHYPQKTGGKNRHYTEWN